MKKLFCLLLALMMLLSTAALAEVSGLSVLLWITFMKYRNGFIA